ncbi:hypothetical protein ACFWG0_27715 [Streptomyces yangpuensis]|uniref:hypothetical protein n=1 Tax=Streptomyces yangpuensis TaxID=1648182 RepID=UPI003647D34F
MYSEDPFQVVLLMCLGVVAIGILIAIVAEYPQVLWAPFDPRRPRSTRPAPDPNREAVRWEVVQRDHDRIKDAYGRLCIGPLRAAELAVLDDLAVPEAAALIHALAAANEAADTTDYPTYQQAALHLAKAWRDAQALTESAECRTAASPAPAPAASSTPAGAELTWLRPHPPIPRERRICR